MCPFVKPGNIILFTLKEQKNANYSKIAKDDLKQLGDVPKSHNPSVLNENHLD